MKTNLLSRDQKLLLKKIRKCALDVRACPRLTVFRACQLISLGFHESNSNVLELLIRSMPDTFGRNLKFFNKGENEISWDERWLVTLIDCVSRADFDSVHFLINSVVQKEYRAEFKTLASETWRISA